MKFLEELSDLILQDGISSELYTAYKNYEAKRWGFEIDLINMSHRIYWVNFFDYRYSVRKIYDYLNNQKSNQNNEIKTVIIG